METIHSVYLHFRVRPRGLVKEYPINEVSRSISAPSSTTNNISIMSLRTPIYQYLRYMVHQTSFFPYSYFQARKYFVREVQLRSKFRVTRGCHQEPLIGGLARLYAKTQQNPTQHTLEVEVALAGARRSPRQGAAASLGSMISKRKHGRARLLQKYAKYRHQMRAARLGRTNYASHAIDKDRWTD